MNIEIVQGNFIEAKEYCESKTRENIFFELSYIETDDKAIFEFNRFKKNLHLSDVIGKTPPKRVILNLSAWNERYLYNKYLEAFLYMLSDMYDEMECKFIVEKKMCKDLFGKINEIKEFELSLTCLSTMVKESDNAVIGFCDNENATGGGRYV